MSTERTFNPGLLGKKLGMTQVITEEGQCVPVTIIQAGPCFVLDVRNDEAHGYTGVQFGFEPKKMQRVNKPEMGQFKKAEKGAFYHVKEIRCDAQSLGWNEIGKEVRVGDIFKDGEHVDVSGTTMGKGFQGVVRRHGVKGQPSTRGTHEVRRHIGAVGCRKFPGRIFKNKRMPGRMGGEKVTIQNVQVVGVRAEDNLILIRGGVPGARGSLVFVRKSKRAA